MTGQFPAQRASNAENVSIWWRHHDAIGTYNTSHADLKRMESFQGSIIKTSVFIGKYVNMVPYWGRWAFPALKIEFWNKEHGSWNAFVMWLVATQGLLSGSLLGKNDVATPFWRNSDVIITSCVPWVYIDRDFAVEGAVTIAGQLIWSGISSTETVFNLGQIYERPCYGLCPDGFYQLCY